MNTLSPEDVGFYKDNGYFLFHHPVFSPEKFAKLNSIFEEHLAEKGDLLSDELDTPHFRDPRLLDFLLSDEPLDLVEPIIGPNIGLWSSHFISKDPYMGRETPWHEDSAFWNGRLSSYEKIVTVWLAIDPSDSGNGCMRVIPGTHRNGFSEYAPVDMKTNTFEKAIPDVDESQAVYLNWRGMNVRCMTRASSTAPKPTPVRVGAADIRCGYFSPKRKCIPTKCEP